MNVLLLGGGGLIGTPVARALVGAGYHVTVATPSGRAVVDGAEALALDRRDAASLERGLAGRRFDLTVDFLAYDDRDIERLLLVPHTALGRTIMISTGQVYLVTEGARPPFREEDADRPVIPEPEPGTRAHANWVYGIGKRRAEAALLGLRRSHGVRALALRLPVVQGAGDRTGRLWEYVLRLRDGGPLLVPGDLDQPLRFVWSEDVARAIVRLASNWPDEGFAYNLGQADAITVRQFLATLATVLGVEAHVIPCTPEELASAGLDPGLAPFSSRWCSVPDPSLAIERWGYEATAFADFLPQVVSRLDGWRERPESESYSKRAAEREWAATRENFVVA